MRKSSRWLSLILAPIAFATLSHASLGDRRPEFRNCMNVCKEQNCENGSYSIPLQRRLLLWDCPQECDYTCQHIVTDERLARDPPHLQPVLQFHGKWPFYRFFGLQEPFSVIFSLLNFLAHDAGMTKLRESVPASYPFRRYYLLFGYFGLVAWFFSMLFHARDFPLTEKLDYFAAGASVLYGLYYTPVRIFRLASTTTAGGPGRSARRASVLRAWTLLCVLLYAAHVAYLTLWRWDYTYNMAANVAVGALSNLLWSGFSFVRYRRVQRSWAAWPGLIVAWVVLAMGLELLDFPPWGGMIDAHCLWHLGTVLPTVWWYNFLIKDAQEDMHGERLKA